jgi:hypothetical protein
MKWRIKILGISSYAQETKELRKVKALSAGSLNITSCVTSVVVHQLTFPTNSTVCTVCQHLPAQVVKTVCWNQEVRHWSQAHLCCLFAWGLPTSFISCISDSSSGRAVAGFSQQGPGSSPRSSHVESVVDKTALGKVFSEYFGFPCHSFHRLLHTHLHPGLVQQAK